MRQTTVIEANKRKKISHTKSKIVNEA